MYLIISKRGNFKPFVTPYFDPINLFDAETMIAIAINSLMYTEDGFNWYEIEEDHL